MFLNDLFQLVKPEFVRERLEPLERWKGLAVVFLFFQFSWRVKAENLEEIARVGKEPLPPYPIEEIGFEDVWGLFFRFPCHCYDSWWDSLGSLLDTFHFYCIYTCGTVCGVLAGVNSVKTRGSTWFVRHESTSGNMVQIPRALWGVLWTSFHCWWPSILVTIGL